MKRHLCRYAASSLAVLAIGCEGKPTTPPSSPAPSPAASAPAPAPKPGARGEVARPGPSTAPLKD